MFRCGMRLCPGRGSAVFITQASSVMAPSIWRSSGFPIPMYADVPSNSTARVPLPARSSTGLLAQREPLEWHVRAHTVAHEHGGAWGGGATHNAQCSHVAHICIMRIPAQAMLSQPSHSAHVRSRSGNGCRWSCKCQMCISCVRIWIRNILTFTVAL